MRCDFDYINWKKATYISCTEYLEYEDFTEDEASHRGDSETYVI